MQLQNQALAPATTVRSPRYVRAAKPGGTASFNIDAKGRGQGYGIWSTLYCILRLERVVQESVCQPYYICWVLAACEFLKFVMR